MKELIQSRFFFCLKNERLDQIEIFLCPKNKSKSRLLVFEKNQVGMINTVPKNKIKIQSNWVCCLENMIKSRISLFEKKDSG